MTQHRVVAIFAALLGLAYPFLVWLIIAFASGARFFAFILFLTSVLRLLIARKVKPNNPRMPPWLGIASNYAMLAVAVLVLVFDQSLILQLYPILISLLFLIVFASSLRSEKSIIEHLASHFEKEISVEKSAYMRAVTQLWCGFFVVNMMISALSWYCASAAVWALYNGLISYILMGILFATEYIYRRLIFNSRAQNKV